MIRILIHSAVQRGAAQYEWQIVGVVGNRCFCSIRIEEEVPRQKALSASSIRRSTINPTGFRSEFLPPGFWEETAIAEVENQPRLVKFYQQNEEAFLRDLKYFKETLWVLTTSDCHGL